MVTNASREALDRALAAVNVKHADNVIYNRAPEAIGRRLRFTIRVKDSRKPGARRSPWGNRRMISACWHVHGDLFDALFAIDPGIYVISGGRRITADDGNWQDRNIGSLINPFMYSQACECNRPE